MPLHVGLITPELTRNHGWATYATNLAEGLLRLGARVTIVAQHDSPPLEGATVMPMLPICSMKALPGLLRVRVKAREVLKNCDVIHATAEPYAPLASWIADGREAWLTDCGSYVYLASRRLFPLNVAYKPAFRRLKHVAISQFTADLVGELLGTEAPPVVPLGVDSARFAQVPRNVAKPGKMVLAVGAVSPRKGTLELVRALAKVKAQMPDVRGVIIGNTTVFAEYAAQVKAEIDALGLNENVRLLGRVPDAELMGWYSKADVFALPSMNVGWRFEGFGLVHLEAGAAGLPVIGTSGSGVEDAIEDGVTGLLVPQSGVVDALAEALVRVLGDKDLARRMGEAGRAKALRQTWDATAAGTLALYEEAISGQLSAKS